MRVTDPGHVELPQLRNPPRMHTRPSLLLTRHRAAILVVTIYTLASLLAWALFSYVTYARGKDDSRDETMAIAFTIAAAVLCIGSLVNIYRRRRAP